VLVASVRPERGRLEKSFDYAVPAELASAVTLGTLVRVPLGARRSVRGWVVGLREEATGEGLRPVSAVLGRSVDPEVVELAAWAARRWAGPEEALLAAASAPRPVPDLTTAPMAARPPSEGKARVTLVVHGPADDRWPLVARALAEARAVGGQALVLVPQSEDVPRVAKRASGLGYHVAALPEGWSEAARGATAVVGVRSAALAPLPGLAVALVLDAHDDAYVEERAPTWRAVWVVTERARRRGVPVVLATPAPTVALVEAADAVSVGVDGLGGTEGAGGSERTVALHWPAMELVDLGEEDPRHGLVGERLVRLAREARPDALAVCVLNRKAAAGLVLCQRCRAACRCDDCGAPVAELEAGTLRCRRCGALRPAVCERCGSLRLARHALGAPSLAKRLQAALGGGGRVVQVGGGASVDAAELAAASVVVGTEAALRRIERRRVGAVVLVDFDVDLLAPRVYAEEAALALLARAARLAPAGRGRARLVVQTRVPDHPLLRAVRAGRVLEWLTEERDARRAAGLPPFGAAAVVSGERSAALVEAAAAAVAGALDVTGPTEGRWLVRAPSLAVLEAALEQGRAALGRPCRGVRVEVDPVRM